MGAARAPITSTAAGHPPPGVLHRHPSPHGERALHVGHVFSFTHTDTIARYKRMRGFSVWYPMGWDDNGLPTERRVQNYFGVRCDPRCPMSRLVLPGRRRLGQGRAPSGHQPAQLRGAVHPVDGPRRACVRNLFRYLGFRSTGASYYTTIGEKARRTSQRAFLRLLHRGEAYAAEAPTLWDVDFRTAVAQAELVDHERPGAYHTLAFHTPDGAHMLIDTTRPELLPACVAVVVHPADPRYAALVGTYVTTPLFGTVVPVVAHPSGPAGQGDGAAMVCTFGDVTDVTWWRAGPAGAGHRRPRWAPPGRRPRRAELVRGVALRTGTGGQGARRRPTPGSGTAPRVGRDARRPRPITHAVKFFEKGDRPLEIVTSRQWWIRTLAHKEALWSWAVSCTGTRRSAARYEDWVSGLNSDWLVSRQRFFGIPFPVWYCLDEPGNPITPSCCCRARASSRSTPRPMSPPVMSPASGVCRAGSRPRWTSWTHGRLRP